MDETNEEVISEVCEEIVEPTELDLANEKIAKLELLVKDLEEKRIREQAETVNFKRRKEEETMRFLKYANEDMVLEIIPLLDNFERAIKSSNPEDESQQKFLEGFMMIHDKFYVALEKHDVKEIESLNKEFDPSIHQAVMTEEVEGTDEGIVLEVMQKGYKLKDKVIRPAMVKVSK